MSLSLSTVLFNHQYLKKIKNTWNEQSSDCWSTFVKTHVLSGIKMYFIAVTSEKAFKWQKTLNELMRAIQKGNACILHKNTYTHPDTRVSDRAPCFLTDCFVNVGSSGQVVFQKLQGYFLFILIKEQS